MYPAYVQCLQRPGKDIGSLKIGVTGACEPPDVGARIQTQVLCKQPDS